MVLGEGGERINDLVFTFLLSSMHVIIPHPEMEKIWVVGGALEMRTER